jgi:NADH-quinone oxidoreductase subunit J
MNLYAVAFYLLAAVILGATLMAVTRRHLVHAVLYLIVSFFGSALLFYLFGAPLLAALEVIIYAGAVMILFLFIVMMLRVGADAGPLFPPRQILPAIAMAAIYLAVASLLAVRDTGTGGVLQTALADPRAFGDYLFRNAWLAVEIVSLLLLVALVGALVLGGRTPAADTPEGPAAPGAPREVRP